MYGIGRVCVKIAGRDARRKCVIIDVLDERFVMIDGETRRRKCNISHLEPTEETLEIGKKASHADVIKAFRKLNVEIKEKKPKQVKERPRKARATPSKPKEKEKSKEKEIPAKNKKEKKESKK